MSKTIEVFQDLYVDVPEVASETFRTDMIAAARAPWSTDLVRSRELMDSSSLATDVILFRRDETPDCAAAGLTFWGTETGFYVPNIVPLKIGQLTRSQYNSVLADFLSKVLSPVAARHGATVRSGKTHETAEDWLGEEAAANLRRFSGAANKSTGASHPADQKRWFDFIIAVHRGGGKVDTDRLARWLRDVDGWDDESAHELAGDCEHALSLLSHYDEN